MEVPDEVREAAVAGEHRIAADEPLQGDRHSADREPEPVRARRQTAVADAEVAQEGVPLLDPEPGQEVDGRHVPRVGQGRAGQKRAEVVVVRVDDPSGAALEVVEDGGRRDDAEVEGEGIQERLEGAPRRARHAGEVDRAAP